MLTGSFENPDDGGLPSACTGGISSCGRCSEIPLASRLAAIEASDTVEITPAPPAASKFSATTSVRVQSLSFDVM